MSVFGSVPISFALNSRLIGERHCDIGGAIDDVVVGEDVAIRADDHARTQALLALFPLPGLHVAVAAIAATALSRRRHAALIAVIAAAEELLKQLIHSAALVGGLLDHLR